MFNINLSNIALNRLLIHSTFQSKGKQNEKGI
jgi:hypothetical protein